MILHVTDLILKWCFLYSPNIALLYVNLVIRWLETPQLLLITSNCNGQANFLPLPPVIGHWPP